MAFNPFSAVKNLITGGINKAADLLAGSSIGRSIEKTVGLNANISDTIPKPMLPPTPFGGAGPNGTQPAVVPNRPVLSGPYQNYTPIIQPSQSSSNQQTGAPLFSPVGGENSTYTDAQGNTYQFRNGSWIQISTGAVPASFPPSGGTPPINPFPTGTTTPTPPRPSGSQEGGIRFTPPKEPTVAPSGVSSGQYFQSSGGQNIFGGASLLPGSLGGTFRSAGSFDKFLFPTEDEEKKKKQRALEIEENRTPTPAELFNQILYGNQQVGAGQVDSTGRPLTKTDTGRENIIQLPPGMKPFGFQGGGTLPPGNLTFRNGQFGTVEKIPSPFRGGQATEKFTPIQGAPFSQADQDTIKRLSETTRQPFYPTPTGGPIQPPSTRDLINQSKENVPANLGTQSSTNQTITDRHIQTKSLLEQTNQQYANNYVNDAAIKEISSRSQELLGQSLTPEQVAQYVATDPNGKVLYDTTFQNAKKSLVDEATGEVYKNEWKDPSDYEKLYDESDPKLKELQDFKNNLDTLKNTDPFTNQTVQNYSDQIYKEEGVLETRALITKKQKDLDAVLGVFEGLADEIKDDPDFSKKLKANRLDFLSNKQVTQIKILQRELDTLKEDLKFKVETANNKVNNALKQYQVYTTERSFVQGNIDKINSQIEKASDNARQAFNAIVSNPELAAKLNDREISFIQDNGYFPETFIKKVGELAGTDFKSIVQAQTTSGTKTIYGITSAGKFVAIATVADVSQAGGGITPEISISLSADMTRYQQAIAKVTNDPNKDFAAKAALIQSLIGELQVKYGSNTTALGIVRDTFGNAPTTSNILGGGTASGDTAYQGELQTAITEILNAKNFLGIQTDGARKNKAQEFQGQLLQKYPNYSADIARVFKPYL